MRVQLRIRLCLLAFSHARSHRASGALWLRSFNARLTLCYIKYVAFAAEKSHSHPDIWLLTLQCVCLRTCVCALLSSHSANVQSNTCSIITAELSWRWLRHFMIYSSILECRLKDFKIWSCWEVLRRFYTHSQERHRWQILDLTGYSHNYNQSTDTIPTWNQLVIKQR